MLGLITGGMGLTMGEITTLAGLITGGTTGITIFTGIVSGAVASMEAVAGTGEAAFTAAAADMAGIGRGGCSPELKTAYPWAMVGVHGDSIFCS